MTNERALKYWRIKYNLAKDYWDEHWEAEERHSHQRYVEALEVAIAALENGGAKDVKPAIHAHWIEKNDWIACSNCNYEILDDYYEKRYKYIACPYCGAKMEGGTDNA